MPHVNTAAEKLPRIGPEIEGEADFAEIESWKEADADGNSRDRNTSDRIAAVGGAEVKKASAAEETRIRRKTLPARLECRRQPSTSAVEGRVDVRNLAHGESG